MSDGRQDPGHRVGARRRTPAVPMGQGGAPAGARRADRCRRLGAARDHGRSAPRLGLAIDLHRRRPGRARRLLHLSAGAGRPGLSAVSRRPLRPADLLATARRRRPPLRRARRALHPPGAGVRRHPGVRLGHLGALSLAALDAGKRPGRPRERLRQISARPRGARPRLRAARSRGHPAAPDRRGAAARPRRRSGSCARATSTWS